MSYGISLPSSYSRASAAPRPARSFFRPAAPLFQRPNMNINGLGIIGAIILSLLAWTFIIKATRHIAGF